MAKLVSMKLSKKEANAMTGSEAAPSSLATDLPAYPWGLTVNLDTDALGKLGLTADDFTVGARLTLIAEVEVTACSRDEMKDQAPRDRVGLQITDLCLEDSASKAGDVADAIYGKAKA